MKKMMALFLTAAIAMNGIQVMATDKNGANGISSSVSLATWSDAYESLEEIMTLADVCTVGKVIKQTVEQRANLYFTHSYVETEDGSLYDVLQTGAIIGDREENIPYDLSLLELGNEYFLCLNQTEYSEIYGQYYLIAGGNQGYGLYEEGQSMVYSIDRNDRYIFSSFELENIGASVLSYTAVSSLTICDDIDMYSDYGKNPDAYIWNIWDNYYPKYYVTGDNNVTATMKSYLKNGLGAWNNKYSGLLVKEGTSTSSNVSVYMGYIGDTGFAGFTQCNSDGKTVRSIDGTYYNAISNVGITLNGSINTTTSNNFWKAIACHEMGHALGLLHIGTSEFSSSGLETKAIMNQDYQVFYGQWNLTTPTNADVTKLYQKYHSCE